MQSTWLNNIAKFTKQNSPAILSGTAVAGVIVTAVLASRATMKAAEKLETVDPRDKVLKRQIVKETWALYIPAGIAGASTIACIIGAGKIRAKESAALLAAYKLAETTLREYKDHVVEEIGEVKERKIREKISEDKITANPPENNTVVYTGAGEQLCFDTLTGQYFRSDIEHIRRAENDFNQRILVDDMYASQNDWLSLLGLEPVAQGDIVGWNIEHKLELNFSSHLTPGAVPCLAVEYRSMPLRDYEN